MSRADGSGPHLVSTTSQGAIRFKQMTFWRVERGSTRRHGKNHRGVLRPVSWRRPCWRRLPHLARRLCSSCAGLMIRAARAAQIFGAHRCFPDPERSGENLPIPKLGAESPDRYLLFHELAGNELKRSQERQSCRPSHPPLLPWSCSRGSRVRPRPSTPGASTSRLIAITTSRHAGSQNGHCKKDLPIASRRAGENQIAGCAGRSETSSSHSLSLQEAPRHLQGLDAVVHL